MKHHFTLAISICIINYCSAQTTFQKLYGSSDITHGTGAHRMVITPDAGYVMAGGHSDNTGGSQLYIVKTDTSGNISWANTYGTLSEKMGVSHIAILPDSGFIISGTIPAANMEVDIFLMRLNQYGNIVWVKKYSDAHDQGANLVIPTYDNGFLMAGWYNIYSGSYTGYILLIKTDSIGDTLWTKRYDGNNENGIVSGVQTADSGFVLLDYRWLPFPNPLNIPCLVKTDRFGNVLWTKCYDDSISAYGYGMCATPDNGFAIVGKVDHGQYAPLFYMKLDSVGDMEWVKSIGAWRKNYPRTIELMPDSGFLISGLHDGVTIETGYFIRTNSQGDTLWTRGFDNFHINASRRDLSGNYVGCGYFDTNIKKAVLNKLDQSGNTICPTSSEPLMYYNEVFTNDTLELDSIPVSLTVTSLILSFGSLANQFNHCIQTGIASDKNTFSDPKAFLRDGILTLDFYSMNQGQLSVRLTEITGKIILTTHFKAAAGANHVEIFSGELALGIYIATIYSEKGCISVKVIKE